MSRLPHRASLAPLAAALLLSLTACGGGGSGGAEDAAVSPPGHTAAPTQLAAPALAPSPSPSPSLSPAPEPAPPPDTPPETPPGNTPTPPPSPHLTVRARADLAGGIGAVMEVRLDGRLLGTVDVRSTEPADHRFDLDAPPAAGAKLQITYVNDGRVGDEDRNLHVLYVTDGGLFVLPNAPGATIDKGAGAKAFDGLDVVPGQSALYGPGTLQLAWPAAPALPANHAARLAASRFLQQASFGPTPAEVQRVARIGERAWLHEQLAMPHRASYVPDVQRYFDRGDAWRPGGASYTNRWPAQRFWANVATAPDQLRRRTAYALHHVLMVSQADGNLFNHVRAYASYLDTLDQHAFGNYRDLLEAVALSPAMGIYLSHMRNRPEDPASGRTPDENFARELMQLFSIGLHELKPDGSPRLDNRGRPIETYSNDDVMAMARVFTGWSWAFPDAELTENNFRWKSPSTAAGDDQKIDLLPMKAYPGQHSPGAKTLFAGKPWQVTIPEGSSGPQSLRIALDALFRHPNVGPFLGRQLIQRLVTGDPSPAYVARVAAAFDDNGRGVRGDLAAVVRAILLDPEARSTSGSDIGKVREPVLRLAHWMRAFGATSATGEYLLAGEGKTLQQRVLNAPSVFGYFRPGYVPPNTALADAGRTAPEFQIVDETTVAQWINLAQQMATAGLGWTGNGRDVSTDYAALAALSARGDLEGLLSELDLLLFAGRMPADARADIVEAVAGVGGQTAVDHANRARVAVLMAITHPDYLIQR